MNIQDFIVPKYKYHGKDSKTNREFLKKLVEFSCRVSIITNLFSNGKITKESATERIEHLYAITFEGDYYAK